VNSQRQNPKNLPSERTSKIFALVPFARNRILFRGEKSNQLFGSIHVWAKQFLWRAETPPGGHRRVQTTAN
jgi:hypothetical protein